MAEDSYRIWFPIAFGILMTVSGLMALMLMAYRLAIRYCLPLRLCGIVFCGGDCGCWCPDLCLVRRRRSIDRITDQYPDDDYDEQINHQSNHDSFHAINRDTDQYHGDHEAMEYDSHHSNQSNVSVSDTSDNHAGHSPVLPPRIRYYEEVRFHMDIVEEESSLGLQRPRRVRCRWQV